MASNQSIIGKILANSNHSPSDSAILAPGRLPLSYQELASHLLSTILDLTRLGFRSGDRLAVVLPNGPEMATSFLAISSICTCAPLNPNYPLNEYKFSLGDLNAKALMTSEEKDHPAIRAANELSIPIIKLEPDAHTAGVFKLVSDLPQNETIVEPVFSEPDDIALVLHTSGTTSRPKIVPLTNKNIYFSSRNIADTYNLSKTDRCLNMMPLFHIHGLMGALVSSLVSGGSVVCTPGYREDQVLDWLSGLDICWYTAVPTIHHSLSELAHSKLEIIQDIHLRFIRSSSSSLAPQLARDLEEVFNCPVLEAYGMTEATHQMASNPLPTQTRKFGSVGLPTGTTKIAILDEEGNLLDDGMSGEICIRGENVMGGYENNPEANAASFVNGWLRTGDRGVFDKDGYLFIQSRIKELINRGGEKISPREIDEVLLSHPAVRQVVTFSMPHPRLGEDIAAAVVLEDKVQASAHDLRNFSAQSLADFKIPRLIVFLSEIPKGPTGKLQRIGLAEKLRDQLDEARKQETSSSYEAHTDLEAEIQDIWQQVLDQGAIGIEDDFLALGGDSLKAAAILMKVNEKYGLNLSMMDIFDSPTISSIAKFVQEMRNAIK